MLKDFLGFIEAHQLITGLILGSIIGPLIKDLVWHRFIAPKVTPKHKVHVAKESVRANRLSNGKYGLIISLYLVSYDVPVHINRIKLNGVDNEANITLSVAGERMPFNLSEQFDRLPSKYIIEIFSSLNKRVLKHTIKNIRIK